MLLSPLVDAAIRLAPAPLAFRLELRRLRRWKTMEPEWLLLDSLVDPQRAAVDVGASRGLYAGRLAELCPWVHGVEPQPRLVAELRRKLPRNTTIHAVALSDQPGEAVLRIPPDDGRASLEPHNAVAGDRLTVPVARLDELVEQPVGFMKIDVEGHELAVLRGAERILRADRPVLLIESEALHHPAAPFNLFEHLGERGYAGWFLWQGERLAVERFVLDIHQRLDCNPAYANNFVFEPR